MIDMLTIERLVSALKRSKSDPNGKHHWSTTRRKRLISGLAAKAQVDRVECGKQWASIQHSAG